MHLKLIFSFLTGLFMLSYVAGATEPSSRHSEEEEAERNPNSQRTALLENTGTEGQYVSIRGKTLEREDSEPRGHTCATVLDEVWKYCIAPAEIMAALLTGRPIKSTSQARALPILAILVSAVGLGNAYLASTGILCAVLNKCPWPWTPYQSGIHGTPQQNSTHALAMPRADEVKSPDSMMSVPVIEPQPPIFKESEAGFFPPSLMKGRLKSCSDKQPDRFREFKVKNGLVVGNTHFWRHENGSIFYRDQKVEGFQFLDQLYVISDNPDCNWEGQTGIGKVCQRNVRGVSFRPEKTC